MAGETNSFMQLAGLGLSLASAIPTKQDKMQRRIAMGGEDPAVAALRRRLAAQNAQTAMSVAASQQGVNPALAQRNAQQALAQQQIQTNAELARNSLSSAMAARASDPVGRRRDLGLQMGANFLNTAGTMLSAQQASAMAGAPAAGGVTQAMSAGLNGGTPAAMPTTTVGGPESAMGLAAPSSAALLPQMPVGPDGQPLFDPNAPTGASPQGQLTQANPAALGGNLGPQASYGTPAPQVQVPAVPPIQPQLPQAQVGMPASQVLADAAAPQATAPVGQLPQAAPAPLGGPLGQPTPGAAPPPSDPRTWASPTERPIGQQTPAAPPSASLPPELLQDPKNAGLLAMYDDAMAAGDTARAELFLRVMNASQMNTTLPSTSTPR